MEENTNDEERPSLRNKPSPRERGVSKERVKLFMRLVSMVAVTLMVLPVMLALTMPTASAMAGEEYAVQNPSGMSLFFVGIFIGIIVLALQVGGLDIVQTPIGVLAVICTATLLMIPGTLGILVAFEAEEPVEPPIVIPPEGVTWMMDWDVDGDVAGNTYPAAPFTVVDTAIGGTTGEWTVADDDALVNDGTKVVSASVSVNTTMNWDNALWMEPNAVFLEAAYIKLLDGPKASDGSISVQQYWGRIDSIDYVVTSKVDNDTTAGVMDPIYFDADWRHHIGWQDEAGIWLEACSEYRGRAIPAGASCGPVPLGSDDTTSDVIKAINTGGIRLFWIWEDRGPFNWNAENGHSWSLTFSVGSEGDWHTYVFTAHYTESATADNA